jgi:hypothetical protein
LYDKEVELKEEQIREEFKKSNKIFTETSYEGPAWAAMTVADEIYESGYDSKDDWPMILLSMDPLGVIHRVDIEMELRPEFNFAKPTKLFESNVDDQTLPMFPNFAEE